MKNEYEDYERYMKNRPHVVILGAGASCAAIPNGDKHDKKISAMSGFIEKLGLSSVISKVDIRTSSDNLEDIYMELDERSKADPLCQEVKELFSQCTSAKTMLISMIKPMKLSLENSNHMCYMVANQLFNVTIHKSVLCHMRLMKDILKSADVL